MIFRGFFFILLLLLVRIAGAAVLKGVVIENGIGGPPVPNLEVSAAAGSYGPIVSRSDGTFTHKFPERQPGDTVRIIVQKARHVVVNDVQLEHTLPSDPDVRPLVILLCRREAREEMARRFYRLKSVEAIEASYRQQLRKLEQEQTASAGELAKLAEQRDRAIAAAGKAAEELARTRPGEASALYRQAMRLFLDGNIEEALELLNDQKLLRLTELAKKQKAEAEQELAEIVDAWFLKGQLLTVQFRFEEAERAYAAAVDASPESFEANFALARFAQDLNRLRKARSFYEVCLKLARSIGNEAQMALTLNGLGVIHRAQNRIEEAGKAYEEALKFYGTFAEKDPEQFSPHVDCVKRLLDEMAVSPTGE